MRGRGLGGWIAQPREIGPAQHSSRQSSRSSRRSERLRNVPPLDISVDQFEALAHRVVAIAAEYLATLDDRATVQSTSAASTSAAFDLPVVLDDLTAIT